MSTNLKPYTVSEMWPLRDGKSFRVAIQFGPNSDVNPLREHVIKSSNKLAALLNEAYEAGAKAEHERCRTALLGLRVPDCFGAQRLIDREFAPT